MKGSNIVMNVDNIDIDELFSMICKELSNGRDIELNCRLNGIDYNINVLAPNGYVNFPSILAVPQSSEINNQIVMESNNFETGSLNKLLLEGSHTLMKLIKETSNPPAPVVVPLLPSYKNGPYFQQLSAECFDLPRNDENYRIDEQVVEMINNAKDILTNEYNIKPDDKIFLNGYSASGVFAQRFALLHPEIVGTACIGGASGSIPIPSDLLSYPLGTKDYEKITGKKFDEESYKNIKFRYFVGEFEKAGDRFDEYGNKYPMHDMSYFDRSVPVEVGEAQRSLFGEDLFVRANNTVNYIQNCGIDIDHYVIEGRSHNNKPKLGLVGCNELGDNYSHNQYVDSIKKSKNL